jgi:hypothetical protein
VVSSRIPVARDQDHVAPDLHVLAGLDHLAFVPRDRPAPIRLLDRDANFSKHGLPGLLEGLGLIRLELPAYAVLHLLLQADFLDPVVGLGVDGLGRQGLRPSSTQHQHPHDDHDEEGHTHEDDPRDPLGMQFQYHANTPER